jgi:transposase
MSDTRGPYPSDLSDAEWGLLAPLLPPSASRGRPRKWAERIIADAVFYVLRSGCAWRMLPREFPPWQTVYARFRRWRVSGTLRRAHDVLRTLVRTGEGRASGTAIRRSCDGRRTAPPRWCSPPWAQRTSIRAGHGCLESRRGAGDGELVKVGTGRAVGLRVGVQARIVGVRSAG